MIKKIKKLAALIVATIVTLALVYVSTNYLIETGKVALEKREAEYISEFKSEQVESTAISTISLKSGGQLNGIIKEETETGYILDVGFGVVAVAKEDVLSLTVSADDTATAQIKENFKKHLVDTASASSKKKP